MAPVTALGFTDPLPNERWISADGDMVDVEVVTATSVQARDERGARWMPLRVFLDMYRFYEENYE